VQEGQTAKGYLGQFSLPDGSTTGIPILVLNGAGDGPRIWLGACIHGIEIAGIEVLRKVLRDIVHPETLRGTVVGALIQNPFAFRASSRHTPYDSSDANRQFSDASDDSLSRYIARAIFAEASKCDYLVDIHGNVKPSVSYVSVIENPVRESFKTSCSMAEAFGLTKVIQKREDLSAPLLHIQFAALGKPSLLVELESAQRLGKRTIAAGVQGLLNVLGALNMIDAVYKPQDTVRVIDGTYATISVFSDHGGLASPLVDVGEPVKKGEVFMILRDAFGEITEEIRSPVDGFPMAYPWRGNQAATSGTRVAFMAHPVPSPF